MNTFTGHLICIGNKSDDTHVDEDVLLEVTDLNSDGEVEIAWNDRNERCYVRFKLADLVREALEKHVPSST